MKLFLYLIVKFVKKLFFLKIRFLENLDVCKISCPFLFFTKNLSRILYLDLKKQDDIFYYQTLIMFLLN